MEIIVTKLRSRLNLPKYIFLIRLMFINNALFSTRCRKKITVQLSTFFTHSGIFNETCKSPERKPDTTSICSVFISSIFIVARPSISIAFAIHARLFVCLFSFDRFNETLCSKICKVACCLRDYWRWYLKCFEFLPGAIPTYSMDFKNFKTVYQIDNNQHETLF